LLSNKNNDRIAGFFEEELLPYIAKAILEKEPT
jgi:hypothetical protein